MNKKQVDHMDQNVQNEQVDKNAWSGLLVPVAVGIVLQAVGIQFLLLQWILPTIGLILVYVGVRELRHQNRWFRVAQITALGALWLWAFLFLLLATPVAIVNEESGPVTLIGVVSILKAMCLLGVLLAAWKGIRVYFQEHGMPQSAWVLIGFAVWIAGLNVAGLLFFQKAEETGNWTLAIIILVVYVAFAAAIFGLGNKLDKTGLIPTYSKIKYTGTRWGLVYMVGITVLVVGIGVFVNHPIVKGELFLTTNDEGRRTALVDKGIPEEIAEVLSGEALNDLYDAPTLEVREEVLKNTKGDRLYAGTVFFQSQENTVYALEYFQLAGRKAFWNDGFVLWGDGIAVYLDGKMAYDKDGQTYTAEYGRAGRTVTKMDALYGVEEFQGITGGVSYPFGTENHRGYVLVELKNDRRVPEYVQFHYGHFKTPFRFPYDYPENMILSDRSYPMIQYTTFVE